MSDEKHESSIEWYDHMTGENCVLHGSKTSIEHLKVFADAANEFYQELLESKNSGRFPDYEKILNQLRNSK